MNRGEVPVYQIGCIIKHPVKWQYQPNVMLIVIPLYPYVWSYLNKLHSHIWFVNLTIVVKRLVLEPSRDLGLSCLDLNIKPAACRANALTTANPVFSWWSKKRFVPLVYLHYDDRGNLQFHSFHSSVNCSNSEIFCLG